MDGSISLDAKVNMGERRTAVLSIHDRHGVPVHELELVQDGIELVPAQFVYKLFHQDQTFEIQVQSNSAFSISKEDEDVSWYSFTPEFIQGDGTLQTHTITVHLDANTSPATRPAVLVLSTPDDDPEVVPVVRKVTIKQAFEPKTVRTVFTAAEVGNWNRSGTATGSDNGVTITAGSNISKSDMPPGIYSFHNAPVASGAVVSTVLFNYRHLFQDGATVNYEVQYGFNTSNVGQGKTFSFVTPWAMAAPSLAKPVAYDQPHVRTFRLERLPENPDYMRFEWLLDDVSLVWYGADGKARTYNGVPQNGAFVLPYNSNGTLQLTSTGGATTFSWYEYTPNIDWGD